MTKIETCATATRKPESFKDAEGVLDCLKEIYDESTAFLGRGDVLRHEGGKSVAGQRQPGLLSELFGLLRHNKKWWLAPILFVMGAVAALVLLSGHGAAPFIYTLF